MRMQSYELHLIPPDLRREEAILQIADSLDYLKKITDSIYKRIQDRVAEYNNRLQSVQKRADLAQKKINKIKGSSKATKVFSSCKYPAVDVIEEYKALFTKDLDIHGKQFSNYHVKSRHITPDEKILKQKLQFYNIRVPERHKERSQMVEEGLGRLPRELDSVSTLLLFNTSENPYKKYVVLDPLGAVTKTRKSLEEETEAEEIAAAPISITQRDHIESVEKMSYFYNPGLGEVPEMDVPLALPDLPGIADDLMFSGDLEPSIAPSSIPVISSSVLPDLPSVGTESSPNVAEVSISNASTATLNLPSVPQETTPSVLAVAPPPPPPPPPPPSVSSPPTEMPAESDSLVQAQKKPSPITGAPEAVVNPGDARANLLESIRQAGGKTKLKSVTDRKLEAKKKKEEEKTVKGGGDLMSDLFNKLQMRRKGISGANRTGSVSENSPQPTPTISTATAMEKISAMIPPPPINKTKQTVSDDEEPVDDDDDDWE